MTAVAVVEKAKTVAKPVDEQQEPERLLVWRGVTVEAVYEDGVLRPSMPLPLAEGSVVSVIVQMPEEEREQVMEKEQIYLYPNQPQPPETLKELVGLMSVGGDALADSEAIYDPDW